jgi:hypothetical protein
LFAANESHGIRADLRLRRKQLHQTTIALEISFGRVPLFDQLPSLFSANHRDATERLPRIA